MSQNSHILAYLEQGNRITDLEALNLFQCRRLAARIHNLRAEGHDIKDEWLELPSDKRVKRYYLERKPEQLVMFGVAA